MVARSRTVAAKPKRSTAGRVFLVLIVLVILLIGAATAGWYYLAGALDRRIAGAIDAAAGGGTTIGCVDRTVFGFPFRLGLSCDAVSVDAPANGIRATAGSLKTAAQVYEPSHIVAELTGPLDVDAPDTPPLRVDWTLAQASTSLWTEGLERLALVLEAPVVSIRQAEGDPVPFARSDHLEVHARRNGAALDAALTDRGILMSVPGLPELPPFDLAADLTVDGAAGWLQSGIPGGRLDQALRGEAGTIRSLALSLPSGGAADISGPFRVNDTGEISGNFRLALENPQAIAGLVEVLVPGASGIATAIAGGIGFAGRQENGRTVIDIQVRDGRAQLGFIPLGRIPPI